MSFIDDFGPQAAQSLLGAGLGIVLGGINDRRQINQQQKLQGIQIRGQKEMTDYQMRKQLEMWDKTNYSAQIAQLHKAGLNPALLYSKAGPGGAIANVPPGTVSSGAPPVGGGEITGMAMTAANLGLLRAQKENIEADTANKRADIPVKGAQVPKLQAETASITQGIENQKAAKELQDIQIGIQSVQEHITKMTQNAAIAKILSELRYTTAQMHIWERNNNIDAATADEKIQLMEQQVIESGARILLTKAQTGQTIEQTNNIAKQLSLAYSQLQNEQDKTAIQKKLQEFETSFGGQASNILRGLLDFIPIGRGRGKK